MKNALLYISFFFCFFSAQAQYIHDVNGRPLLGGKYIDVVGSPYLFENWSKGEVQMIDGTIYKDIELKYDQVEGFVFFKGKKGEDMEFTSAVKSFTIYQDSKPLSFNQVPEIKDPEKNSYYQILTDGKSVKLLKKVVKVVREGSSYGSATITKNFAESTNYYLLKADGTYTKIKKDKKSLLNSLGDKSTEIEKFIKENKTSFKEESSLVAVIDYYNAL